MKQEGEIVVTGPTHYIDDQLWFFFYGLGSVTWTPPVGGGGGGGEPPPPPDEAQIEVRVAFTRPLTAMEQTAVNNLKTAIAEQTAAINKLPNDAKIKLKSGEIVTGEELKKLWSKSDFVINEADHRYNNGTTRGEADYNSENPVISYNIDILEKYDKHDTGMNYLVAHELGHVTKAGRHANEDFKAHRITDADNEIVANDIARAIVHATGEKLLVADGIDYSTQSEQYFTSGSGNNTITYNGTTSYSQYPNYDPSYNYAFHYINPETGHYQPTDYYA